MGGLIMKHLMNEMLTKINRLILLLTISNPQFLIANYNRTHY
jgi:hypothetical protein